MTSHNSSIDYLGLHTLDVTASRDSGKEKGADREVSGREVFPALIRKVPFSFFSRKAELSTSKASQKLRELLLNFSTSELLRNLSTFLFFHVFLGKKQDIYRVISCTYAMHSEGQG